MKIKLKKLTEDAVTPKKATPGSNAYDMYSTDEVVIEPGLRVAISTGISMKIPEGYVGLCCPRSGLAINYGITVINGPGVIDSDYRGEIKILLINEGASTFVVKPKERIAQILFVKTEDVQFDEVQELGDTNRSGGFGSTGR